MQNPALKNGSFHALFAQFCAKITTKLFGFPVFYSSKTLSQQVLPNSHQSCLIPKLIFAPVSFVDVIFYLINLLTFYLQGASLLYLCFPPLSSPDKPGTLKVFYFTSKRRNVNLKQKLKEQTVVDCVFFLNNAHSLDTSK